MSSLTAYGDDSGTNTDAGTETATTTSDADQTTAASTENATQNATNTTAVTPTPEGVVGETTLISPINTISDNTPTYTWNAVNGATWYYLWVNDSSGNKIKTWHTASKAGCSTSSGTCSITPTTSLGIGSGTWWIQAYDSDGHGPWSDGQTFNLTTSSIPGTATLVSPSDSISDNTPSYTWNAVNGATWYYLWVNDSSGNKIKTWHTASAASCSTGNGTCSITPTTSLGTGSGTWWIQAYNTNGYGSWSDGQAFNLTASSTPGTATLVSPSGSVTDSTPTYTWNAVNGATWYYLWVNDSTGNKIKTWHTAVTVGCSTGTGTCSITPTTSLDTGSGTWWIQAYNTNGYGSWSNSQAFSLENTFASKATLGEQIFADPRFSFNRTQSCATCHSPGKGFIDDRDNGVSAAVSLGDDGTSLGNRNSPTVTYAALTPDFSGNDEDARGGQFLDGRAANLQSQAGQPFLNPLEMNMPDQASVVARMMESSEYMASFRDFYGDNIFDDTNTAFLALTDVLATFQATSAVSPFDSKYDRALAGTYTMSNPELQGMNLFFSNQTSCLECHRVNNLPNRSPDELFTSHRYFNIGTPANQTLNNHLQSIGQQADLVNNGDQGLFSNPVVNNDQQTRGLFKVPTLRNTAVTAPYMHNGVFSNLQTVLHFYDHQGARGNRRPTNPETGLPWRNPEVNANIDNNRLRMPGLNNNEVDVLECFLRALTDAQFEEDLPPLRTGLNCS